MIADVFIKRPVTAMVVSVVLVLLGALSIFTLPIAQYPDITPPTVSVTGNFTGADATTVEQTTTTAIETQINGSPGMIYMSSNSTSSGVSSITVTFQVGTNIDISTLDVQNRVSIAQPTLPSQVQRLGVTTRKRNPAIMMALALYSPHGTHSALFLGNYTNIYLQDVIKRIDGVGDVFTRGQDFSMRVWLDPIKMTALGLTTSDVTAAITEQNIQIAGGTLGGTPQPEDQQLEFTLLTDSRLYTKDQFGNIIIKNDPQTGKLVYLKDVARVELGAFDYSADARVSNKVVKGSDAAFLMIFLSPGANALSTYDAVVKKLNQMKATSFPADVDYAVPFETASVITASIDEVLHTFVEALLLVVVVVFLFLQNWRATLIPVLAIPVSLVATFIFFNAFGFTINTLTLFAFVLAIGIVVDDAIVVVEAVQHYIDHEKMTPKEATHQAMSDISGPVIAIALILAAVFVPVSFVPGISGRLYQQFAITIAVSVIISAFVALSLTPALCTLMLRETSVKEDAHKSILQKGFDRFNRWFEKVTNGYTNWVAFLIKRPIIPIVALIAMVAALVFFFKSKATGFLPQEDEGRLFVAYQMKEGTSIEQSNKMLIDIMHRVSSIPAVSVIGGLGGYNAINSSNKSNSGTIFVNLKPWEERTSKEEQLSGVIAAIMQKTADIKTAMVIPIAPPPIQGLGNASGVTFELQQTSSTDSIQVFEQIAQKFIGKLMQQPELGRVYTFFTTKTPNYRVTLDRKKAKQLGVSVSDAYGTLQTLMGSTYVNDVTLYGRNFKVMAMADSSFRSNLSDFSKFYVRNSLGSMIPLSSLVSTKLVEAPSVITHYNIYRNIEINGVAKDGYSSGQSIEAFKRVADQTLPAGYSYEFTGMSLQEMEAGNATVYIFMASFIFVFLFLAALYESWSIPLVIILAVPIGLFGAMATMMCLPSLTNNIYTQIGMLTIIGLAAKNAILIVEFAKERVDHGMDIIPATLQAVNLRLRPIIMTSLAFILGVIPLAIATGAASESRQTLGWTVLGGMIAASSLAIFVVPVLFSLIAKIAYPKSKLHELKIKAQENVDGSGHEKE